MVKRASADVKIGVDAKDASKGLKDLERSFKRSAVNINAALELVGKAWGAVSGALGTVIELSNEQIKVERKFVAALKLRGAETDKVFKETQKFNAALQQQTSIGDEVLLKNQQMLVSMGVSTEDIQVLTEAAVGLSSAYDKSLAESFRAVGKAALGNTESLREVGIATKDANKAIGDLAKNVAVAKDNSKTFGGQMSRLKGNFDDFLEVIGTSATDNGTMVMALNSLNESFLTMSKTVAEKVVPQLKEKLGKTLLGLSILIKSLSKDASLLVLAGGQTGLVEKIKDDRAGKKAEGAAGKKTRLKTKNKFKPLGELELVKPGPSPFSTEGGGLAGALAIGDGVRPQSFADAIVGEARRAPEELKNSLGPVTEVLLGFKKSTKSVVQETASVVADGFTNMFVGIGEALAHGENVLKAMGAMLGGMIKQLGVVMIQTGLAAQIGWIPGPIGAAAGGPAAGTAGLVAIAGGTAMVALGTLMGAGGRSTGTGKVSPQGGVNASGGGFSSSQAGQRAGSTTRVVNVNFGRGLIVGSEQRLARDIAAMVERAGS